MVTEVTILSGTSDYLLTTVDNPWNPFTNWDEWNDYDHQYGHCTWELVDRLKEANTLPTSLDDVETDRAVDALLLTDYENKYIKVTKAFPFDKLFVHSTSERRRLFSN